MVKGLLVGFSHPYRCRWGVGWCFGVVFALVYNLLGVTKGFAARLALPWGSLAQGLLKKHYYLR